MVDNSDDLGPLPGTDRNDELERESLAALNSLLPPDRFRVRAEPGRDQGIDRFIEVLVDGHDTNFRGQVQLKATETALVNQDGSISYSVDTSNLNYLLNGTCPLYALWIADRRELRFAWARNEQQRLEGSGRQWIKQAEVSLRFARRVADSLNEIRDRIIAEGRLHRRIHQRLLLQTLAEPVALQLDAATLEATSSDQANERLQDAGISLVAAGRGDTVLTLINTLNSAQRNSARMHLIAGYAHFVRDRFHMARGELAEAALLRDALQDNDRVFLDRLLNASDLELGHLSEAEYDAREQTLLQSAGGSVRDLYRLDELRFEHLAERDRARSAQLLQSMQNLASSLAANTDVPVAARLSARAVLLYAEGHQQISAYLRELHRALTPPAAGETPPALPRPFASAAMRAWRAAVYDLIHEAQRHGNPLAIADAYYALGATMAALLVQLRATEHIVNGNHGDIDDVVLTATRSLGEAGRLFAEVRSLRSQLLANLVQADVAEIQGDVQSARETAADVARQASIMRYAGMQTSAENLIAGRSAYATLMSELRREDALHQDALCAERTDEELHRMASDILDRYDLPAERLPHIEEEFAIQRRASRERVEWCRQLEILSSEHGTPDRETLYLQPPRGACHCRLFTDRLIDGGSQPLEALNQFKSQYCATCDRREPLTVGAPDTDPE